MHESYKQALSHCESLDSFRSSRSGESSISEDEVASQILVPLMEQLVKSHIHAPYMNSEAGNGQTALGDQQDREDSARRDREASKGTLSKQSSDVWAAARIAYELLVGEPSFQNAEMPQESSAQCSLPGFLGFLSVDCADFLQFALKKEESERPTADQCLSHPWLQYHMSKQQDEGPGLYTEVHDNTNDSQGEGHLHSVFSSASAWRIKARDSGCWSSDASSSSDVDMSPYIPPASFDAGFQDEAEDIQPRCAGAKGKRSLRRPSGSRLRNTAAVNFAAT